MALLSAASFACGGTHLGGAPSAAPAPGNGPPPAGGTPTDPSAGPTGYHLIDIGHAGFGVATVSRGGKVLLSNGYTDAKRFVYDIATGTTRDAPAAAASVNDAGTIVGIRTVGKDATGQCEDYEVFLQQPDGSLQGIGNPVYGDYGTLRCGERGGYGIEVIDNQGRPVVRWRSDSTAHPGGTFRWNGSGWDRLQPVGSFVGGAAAVNDRGDIAGGGGSSEGGLVQHAAMWRNGSMTEIGTFGGTISYARGINDAGQVAGYATQTAGATDERPFLWSNGILQRLDLPPGYAIGEAYGIADNGDVAGLAMVPLNLGAHGMLWSGGKVYDLNDLIDTHDWLVTSVAGATRDGNIVAYANNREMQTHPVVLIRKGPAAPDRSWRGGGKVLADGQTAVTLAVDGGKVYWHAASFAQPAGAGHWSIESVAQSGGTVSVAAQGAGYSGGPLLVDSGSFWFGGCMASTPCGYGDFGVWQVLRSGGTATRVAPGSGQFALRGGVLFSKDRGASGQGVVYRTPAAGGTPQVIDTMRIVYRWPGPVSGIEADDKTVFYTWTDANETVTVRAQPLGGGASRDLFPPESRFVNTARLVLDGGFVYLQAAQEIVRVPAAGGAPEQVVPHLTQNARIRDMDVRDGRVWWTVPSNADGQGCLWRANADGSDATAVECGLWDYGPVRADASGVYVVRDLQVVRFPK